jgi:hypothetical protein
LQQAGVSTDMTEDTIREIALPAGVVVAVHQLLAPAK